MPLTSNKAIKVVREFMTGPKTLLVLTGGVGCGKTAAATWAMTWMGGPSVRWNRTIGARFVPAAALRTALGFERDQRKLLDDLESTRLLVLDDLGAEHLTEYVRSGIDALIDHRYGHELKTIATSNLALAQFKSIYGERIADRIR